MWTEDDLGLETQRFTLRPLAKSDAGGLLAHFRDPQVVEFMDIEPLQTLSQAQDIVEWATEIRAAGQGVRWAIRSREGQRLIGTVGFNTLEFQRGRRGELAYDLAIAFWGQGVMGEVLGAVIPFGFEALGLRRIEAMVTPGNDRSIRLLERLGFQCEGRLRDHAFWKGRFWDQLVYARLG